jgi:cell division septum initiation protein DivIVA
MEEKIEQLSRENESIKNQLDALTKKIEAGTSSSVK